MLHESKLHVVSSITKWKFEAWMLKTNLWWGTWSEKVRLQCGVVLVATVPLWLGVGQEVVVWSNKDLALLFFLFHLFLLLLLDSFCVSQLEREIWSMLMSGSGYSYTCMWREEGNNHWCTPHSLRYPLYLYNYNTLLIIIMIITNIADDFLHSQWQEEEKGTWFCIKAMHTHFLHTHFLHLRVLLDLVNI